MQRVLFVPVVASVLFATACGGDDPTSAGPPDNVRFFNATTGMTGSGGFTTNGQFATALAFGQSKCSGVSAGSTSFGFGAANAGGTGVSGSALATLNSQTISAGGSYTVVATGPAASPTLFLLDNGFTGAVGTNQAAVRFVNFAPGSANLFNVFIGELGAGGTLHATNLAVGAPTTFNTVTSGSNVFTVLHGHDIAITGSAATLSLQGGTVNTLAIVPNTSGGFQLVNLPRC